MDDSAYLLYGVEETGERVGVGSYNVVSVVWYKGLRCAAKTLKKALFTYTDNFKPRERFWRELKIHNQLRHPNIVLLIGYFYNQTGYLPSLVMELLFSSLYKCIDRYGILPNEVSYSILQDVALGLRYLHERCQPIIHRDITARAIFLTDNMVAKIGNFGYAVVMKSSDLDCPMTPTPGTPSFMPPEAFPALGASGSACYGIKFDIFSYGVLMIHMFCGEWPLSLKGSTVSEVDRRQEYLDSIGHKHPLMGLISQCLSNDPAGRPTAAEIHEIESNVSSHFHSSKLEEVYRLQQHEGNQTVEVCSRRYEMILKKTIDSIPTSKLHGYVRSELPIAIPESNQSVPAIQFEQTQSDRYQAVAAIPFHGNQQTQSDQSVSVIPFQGNQQTESDQSVSVIPFQGNQQAESDQSMPLVSHQQASKVIHDHTSYLNYHLVEDMVEKFGDDKLKAEMKEYRTDLEKFRKRTTIREFVVPSTGKHIEKFEPLRENYTELSIKLDKDSKVTTLEDIERLRHVITHELSIPPHATLLYAISEGSLVVKFFVKVNKFSIMDEVTERFTYCKRKAENILEIRIDGNVLKMDLKEGDLTLETEVEVICDHT